MRQDKLIHMHKRSTYLYIYMGIHIYIYIHTLYIYTYKTKNEYGYRGCRADSPGGSGLGARVLEVLWGPQTFQNPLNKV